MTSYFNALLFHYHKLAPPPSQAFNRAPSRRLARQAQCRKASLTSLSPAQRRCEEETKSGVAHRASRDIALRQIRQLDSQSCSLHLARFERASMRQTRCLPNLRIFRAISPRKYGEFSRSRSGFNPEGHGKRDNSPSPIACRRVVGLHAIASPRMRIAFLLRVLIPTPRLKSHNWSSLSHLWLCTTAIL